jgi:hypothetical protein
LSFLLILLHPEAFIAKWRIVVDSKMFAHYCHVERSETSLAVVAMLLDEII